MPKIPIASAIQKEVLTPDDAASKVRNENGKAVGALACELFPDGCKVPYDANDMEENRRNVLVTMTTYFLLLLRKTGTANLLEIWKNKDHKSPTV